jgi:hypothetical protein
MRATRQRTQASEGVFQGRVHGWEMGVHVVLLVVHDQLRHGNKLLRARNEHGALKNKRTGDEATCTDENEKK